MSHFFKKIERGIEEAMRKLFYSGDRYSAHPIEIARHIMRAMEDEKRVSVSRIYVPNCYKVMMHPHSVEKIRPLERTVSRELCSYIEMQAKRRGYSFVGPREISFVEESSLKAGEIKVEPAYVEDATLLEIGAYPDGGPVDADGDTSRSGEITKEFNRVPPAQPGQAIREDSPYLIIMSGELSGSQYPLSEDRVSLGRSRSNDIVIPDPGVSREHAEILHRQGAFILRDLNSMNGTFVNERRVGEHVLSPGDSIKLGGVLLEFRNGVGRQE
ncbi:MAG TPA: DUF3662 and FHA domain-containing protein [Firmicutes bacterium]|nr:DUF3662 and FHA domain-containing protein [Bacillota bacterium]